MMTTFIPLKQRYKETIQPRLQKELRLDNIHQAPKLVKVTVNRGLGEAAQNSKALEGSTAEIGKITGQKPIITRAKKAISSFKIRAGMPIGVTIVTTARSDDEGRALLREMGMPFSKT